MKVWKVAALIIVVVLIAVIGVPVIKKVIAKKQMEAWQRERPRILAELFERHGPDIEAAKQVHEGLVELIRPDDWLPEGEKLFETPLELDLSELEVFWRFDFLEQEPPAIGFPFDTKRLNELVGWMDDPELSMFSDDDFDNEVEIRLRPFQQRYVAMIHVVECVEPKITNLTFQPGEDSEFKSGYAKFRIAIVDTFEKKIVAYGGDSAGNSFQVDFGRDLSDDLRTNTLIKADEVLKRISGAEGGA